MAVRKDPATAYVIKRLFVDIETSPNIGYFWKPGHNINIPAENILEEAKIITICYKWQGGNVVNSLTWDKEMNDASMLKKFIPIILMADEVIAHNGDRFDLPWIRTRCIFHRIRIPAQLPSVDTLKQARSGFRFNSNRLDYLGGYLGRGNKEQTGGFKLWKDVMKGDKRALADMVNYCKRDVNLLESVYLDLYEYTKPTSHVGVLSGGYKHDCPKCGSKNTKRNKKSTTSMGTNRVQCLCGDCKSYFTMSEATFTRSKIHEFRMNHGLIETKSSKRRKGKPS